MESKGTKGTDTMRIVYLKLENFIGVKAATGLNSIELRYDSITQPIIQIYGKNRCGKTVLIQQHHPFSSINLNGDERSDLSLIIPNMVGCKNIVYEVDGKVYNITHIYKPSGKTHTVSSSIQCNGEELNPSGGVNTFNTIIENILGINKYIFQFIINGTNLTSFAGMGATQRKNILNKAMGIDIYDKIHRMATEDYRFTSKLITSLNHTKEYLLQTYGSYETLFATVEEKRSDRDKLEFETTTLKSKMDALSGTIQTLRSQNPVGELADVERSISEYVRIVGEVGSYDPKQYDSLVDSQIQMNQHLSELKTEHTLVLRDIDDLFAKQRDIQTAMIQSSQAKHDYDNMKQLEASLEEKIRSIHVTYDMGMSSQFLMSMMSVAQAVNSTCKEIVSALKKEHLEFMVDMIQHNVDVSAFLMKEGTSLLDSEKEKSVISYIKSMMQNVEGHIPDQNTCGSIENCLYRRTYEACQSFFNSYQSQSADKMTRYDLEQMDHAYKNILTIKRLIYIDIPEQLRPIFSLNSILENMMKQQWGIDVDQLKEYIESAVRIEQRNQFISQLEDIRKSMTSLEDKIIDSTSDDASDVIQQRIQTLSERRDQLQDEINQTSELIAKNDQQRLLFSNIQHIDIQSLEKQRERLRTAVSSLRDAEEQYNMLDMQYRSSLGQYQSLETELDNLEKAFDQFVKTSGEIDQNLANDQQFKAIAEATSSTKGMPVITIRDTVDRAINTTNQLLAVMYDTEIELLHPIIDENNFSLPFRCGMNRSADIRYGSQSESTLLSLALSLSLAASLTSYKIPLCDELDAYLDSSIRDVFILMLESMMEMLGMKQMFLISHNLQKGQFAHIVHTVDISELISKQKGSESE